MMGIRCVQKLIALYIRVRHFDILLFEKRSLPFENRIRNQNRALSVRICFPP